MTTAARPRGLAFACLLLGAWSGAWSGGIAAADATPFDRRASAELDRLVRDVCRKDLVVLGEDANHGGGRTLEVKVELVRRLVERCGFGGIVFESSIHASLELERRLAQGVASEDDVVDAAGQLWFRAEEARPLPSFLLRAARDGRLRIGGMDIQPVTSPGRYARQRLAGELAAVLDAPRRAACEAEIQRHNRDDYDDAHPFDEAAQARLRGCIDAVRAAARADADPARARMAVAYGRYLDMAMTGDGDVRERAMFDNLVWYRERWPPGTRIVVWCATVHGAKSLHNIAPAMRPMGADVHARFGRRAAVIGFTALGGAFGQGGANPPLPLRAPPPEALEPVALADARDDLRYLDAKRLSKRGVAAARAINYRTIHATDWASVLDGLVVLRGERPVTPRRPATH